MRATTPGSKRFPTAGRVLALIRLGAVPVFFAAERLVDHPAPRSEPFDALLVLATVYALVALAASFSPVSRRVPGSLYAALDFAFIWALVYTSGGPFSQLRFAFFLLPIGAALLLRPLLTASVSVATILGYVAVSVVYPEATEQRPHAIGFEVTQGIFLAWMGVAATLLSHLLARRTAEVEDLAASRGRLVIQVLDAEDSERRRLAEGLHDEAVQNLLAARQELTAVKAGRAEDDGLALVELGLDRTIEQLRRAVFDLHPYILDHGGLGAALQAVVKEAARRSGFRWHVEVAEEATGDRDQLLFSVARELISNAAKHSSARNVTVSVRREGDRIVLEVADDGCGFDARRLPKAALAGHIGLASCMERVEAAGGTLAARSEPGAGTTVRVAVPAARIRA